jgi:hypothetical protein
MAFLLAIGKVGFRRKSEAKYHAALRGAGQVFGLPKRPIKTFQYSYLGEPVSSKNRHCVEMKV